MPCAPALETGAAPRWPKKTGKPGRRAGVPPGVFSGSAVMKSVAVGASARRVQQGQAARGAAHLCGRPLKAPAGPALARIPFPTPLGQPGAARAPHRRRRAPRKLSAVRKNNNSGRPASTKAGWPAAGAGRPAAAAGRPR